MKCDMDTFSKTQYIPQEMWHGYTHPIYKYSSYYVWSFITSISFSKRSTGLVSTAAVHDLKANFFQPSLCFDIVLVLIDLARCIRKYARHILAFSNQNTTHSIHIGGRIYAAPATDGSSPGVGWYTRPAEQGRWKR